MKTFLKILFSFLLIAQISFAQGFWTKIGEMPEIRYGHTVNELNGKIYVVGGANTETSPTSTTALVYDRSSGEWDTIPLYNNKGRGGHTSCIVNGKLYVIGGNDGSTILSSMDMFDPNTGWIPKNPMPTDRGLLACAAVDGKIYVMGGLRLVGGGFDYSGVKTLEMYDIATDTWTQLPDMPTKRWGHTAVAYNGKIYVVGGVTFFPTTVYKNVEVYNPQDSTWTTKSGLMPTARYCLTSCLLDSNIFAIGGWLNSDYGPIYDKVEVYNPENDEWNTDNPLPVKRALLASIVLDGKIYVYGGSHTNHPLIGTSAIYEFSRDDIFALQPLINKSYARPNIDSVLFMTRFLNLNNHSFEPHLIYSKLDSTQIDSLTLYDDGLHGDSLSNDGVYGAYIPPRQNEDFFTLSVGTIDNQTNKYYNTPDRCRFTTAGPVIVDSMVSALLPGQNRFAIKLYLKNLGSTSPINSPSVKVICTDPWVTSLIGATETTTTILPGQRVSCSPVTSIYYDSLSFPGYFNLKFEIMSSDWTYWKESMQIIVGVDDELNEVPTEFALSQNYPNPFNPNTVISYQLPVIGEVTLKVYDVLGNEVATLVNEEKPAGSYKVNFNAHRLSSGIYFYTISAGSFVETRKMVLLK